MNTPTVLLYRMDPEKVRNIKLLCITQKIRARAVAPEEYGLSLETVLRGDPPEPGQDCRELEEEMLVMANLTGAQMDRFLRGLRSKKIPPVALKAVLTSTNAQWDAFQLCRELRSERQAMSEGKTAHQG